MLDAAYRLKVFRRIGLIAPQLPHRIAYAGYQLVKWGPGFPAAVAAAAARFPKQKAIVDDLGELTWAELRDEVNQLSHALKERGVEPGDSIALLARNHRYIVTAMVAIMQVGARVLLLNTMASGSQLTELATREGAKFIILDEEFLKVAEKVDRDQLLLAWSDGDQDVPTLAEISKGQSTKQPPKPSRRGSVVIFTSGTTGLPKGAKREEPEGLDPLVAFFGAIPYRGNRTMVLAAPLFHSWGLINFGFGLSTAPTYVLRRRFKPEQVLQDIEEHQAEALVVVPLMMQRLVDADPELVKKTDVSSLRITAVSGSALAGELATQYMDTFTDSVYNFYGATETGWVTVASPKDLREAPGTAGRPPWHTTVRILKDGKEVPQGETGTIYVANDMPFGGYTDGNTKEFAEDLMSTGDLGHFDEDGRLFVSGRDDDMIVSGGENVFPRELEDALIKHEDIADVVVTGIDDKDWGQALAAYVVVKNGASLEHDDIVAYAKEHVARFAVPRKTKFLDELPRNPTGKVMKRELPDFD
ncbi:AMP-binding protein [Aeromicrobium terrae]|uniref:AMP-binding protein n=1 Tax=Aeromicrobium terrae TaxID=2498846 RepID=UPI001650CE03|nr:AMP-binding protein [Aeromicrobium terrae]